MSELQAYRKRLTRVITGVLSDDSGGESAGGAIFVNSPVESACHSVVVSVGCPGEVDLSTIVGNGGPGPLPFTCIGLGSRDTKGVILSVRAKASSFSRTVGKEGRSRGCWLQHSCAMFQRSIIPGGILPCGILGRVPLLTAIGTCHDILISSRGILPERT